MPWTARPAPGTRSWPVGTRRAGREPGGTSVSRRARRRPRRGARRVGSIESRHSVSSDGRPGRARSGYGIPQAEITHRVDVRRHAVPKRAALATHRSQMSGTGRAASPRQRKPDKGHGDAFLKVACTQAANRAAYTDTFTGERIRRLPRRLGGNKGQVRSRAVDPRNRVAPAGGPVRQQVPQPRPGLARRPRCRPRAQDPQPSPPAPFPRPGGDGRPRGLKSRPPLITPVPSGATGR